MAGSHGRELWFDTDLGDEYISFVIEAVLISSPPPLQYPPHPTPSAPLAYRVALDVNRWENPFMSCGVATLNVLSSSPSPMSTANHWRQMK